MENIAPALLDWFYANRRILPFRENPTPYHVWLSEIMLQQTRVCCSMISLSQTWYGVGFSRKGRMRRLA